MTARHAFAAAIVGAVLATRVFLHLRPTRSPTVAGFRLHHWHTGMLLAVVGAAVQSAWVAGIGAGLFLDEAVYAVGGGKSHADYVSRWSVLGTAALVGAIVVALVWL